MRIFFTIALFCLLASVVAQVESSAPIIFTDSLVQNRQVKGVQKTTNATDGINVTDYKSGKTMYALASGIDSISLNLPYGATLKTGMLVHFKANGINTGAVVASLNGSSYYPIKKQLGVQLDSAEIQTGQIVSVVFDGFNFICISKLYKPCRNGYVSVNNSYCIDAAPRTPGNFFTSVQACGNDGAMLCTWNQWFIACNDSITNGSGGYLNNFEWVNDAGNNGSDAKVVGVNDDPAYAGYGCKKSYSLPPTLTSFGSATVTSGITLNILFRCCYKK